MANLKEIKTRINSTASTKQITQAMKLVSASKLSRALEAITRMRPYARKIQEIIENVSGTLDLSENRYAEQREVKNVLIIPVSSNRGLCGGFNNNIVKKVNELLENKYRGLNIELLTVGKKINDTFKRSGLIHRPKELSEAPGIFDNLEYDHVAEYAEFAMRSFVDGTYDKVIVVYNEFVNAATQEIRAEQLLPINTDKGEEKATSGGAYIFEPSKEAIITELIPKSLKLQLFKAILDSNASEHGARMTAMHKATDNATELERDLRLEYNKARQAAITNEILEIVGGAEALNG